MKPARLIGILFMVTVLLGMFAVVAAMVGGFAFFVSGHSDGDQGTPVAQQHTKLDKAYTSLGAAGPIDIEWQRDATVSFDVSGPSSLVKKLEYTFENGSLDFKIRHTWFSSGSIKVVVHGPQPKSVALAGSGDGTFLGLDKGDIDVSVAGSGDVEMAGNVNALTINVAGSGNVDSSKLTCETADVTIAGSGDADVNPLKTLSAAIMGSGNVSYHGDPKVTKSIMGSGDVDKKD